MRGNIPADWDGETWTEFCVPCPDSDGWRAALLGAIYALTRGRRWSADSGTIVDAQAVGRAILQDMEEGCCMDANPIIDVSQDACEVTFTYLDETTEAVNTRDCPPAPIRKNTITGALVYWSGTAWIEVGVPAGEPVPDPEDPRFQGGDWETPTPGTGIDVVCRSADAMMKELQQAAGDLVDEIDWNTAAWESTFTIFNTGLSTVAGLFSGFATGNAALGLGIGLALHAYLQSVAEEFLGLANLYTLLEAEGLADPLNSNWTDMRCLLYCNLNDDGQIDYAGHLALMEAIDFQIDTLTDPSWYEFVRPIVEMAGADALNAAYGVYGSTEDDCSACVCPYDWVQEFDFTTGTHGWEAGAGTWVAGTGFVHGDVMNGSSQTRTVNVNYFDMDEFEAVRIETTYSRAIGSYTLNARTDIIFGKHEGTNTVLKQTFHPDEDGGTDLVYVWNGTGQISDQIQLYHRASWGSWTGSASISKVKIFGKGTNPFE